MIDKLHEYTKHNNGGKPLRATTAGSHYTTTYRQTASCTSTGSRYTTQDQQTILCTSTHDLTKSGKPLLATTLGSRYTPPKSANCFMHEHITRAASRYEQHQREAATQHKTDNPLYARVHST
jgi:hypothetical protein